MPPGSWGGWGLGEALKEFIISQGASTNITWLVRGRCSGFLGGGGGMGLCGGGVWVEALKGFEKGLKAVHLAVGV